MVYVLYRITNNTIIAVSEAKPLIHNFILQRDLYDGVRVVEIRDKRERDRILIVHDDIILDEYEGFVLTKIERRLVYETIDENVSRIDDTIESLIFIARNYSLKKRDLKTIVETIRLLNRSRKPKKLSILIGLKEFIFNIISPCRKYIVDMYKDIYKQKDDKIYIHIKK